MRTRPSIRFRRLASLGCLALSLATSLTAQPPHRPAPRFEGSRIPDPPGHDQPWTPPETRLPKFLVTATATLFDQGLADPRGCEYRAIEVGRRQRLGRQLDRPDARLGPAASGRRATLRRRLERHGLPGRLRGRRGRTWRPTSAPGRGRAEVSRRQPEASWIGLPPGLGLWGFHEEQAVAVDSPCRSRSACCSGSAAPTWPSRSGRAGTAGTPRPDGTRPDRLRHLVPVAGVRPGLGTVDRAVCAHMRGDDDRPGRRPPAGPLQQAVAAEIRTQSLPAPRAPSAPRGRGPSIDFLGPLPALLADQERRAEGAETPAVPPPGARLGPAHRRPDPRHSTKSPSASGASPAASAWARARSCGR